MNHFFCFPPICDCCGQQAEGIGVRPVMHDTAKVCRDCVLEWYDSAETDPAIIGARVRAKRAVILP